MCHIPGGVILEKLLLHKVNGYVSHTQSVRKAVLTQPDGGTERQ